jgi:hypothetical protein
MTKLLSHTLLVALTLGAVAAAGCSSDSGDDGGSGGTGGTGATGGTGGSMPGTGNNKITISETGWVDLMDAGNDVGIQGAWYPYGDQYGNRTSDAKCIRVGMHTAAECSFIESPTPPPAVGDPPTTGFPNVGGEMCTKGEVAVIPMCKPNVGTSGCPAKDYANVWGAGIGFDFNANKGPPEGDGAKRTWDPAPYNVIGVSFEITNVPLAGLRVEFPILLTAEEATAASLPAGSTTDDHPDGAPYWGATSSFPKSPVVAGAVNTIKFATDVKPPRTNYAYVPNKMLGIQFHVPAVAAPPRSAYEFCIKNLTFLRE